MNLDFIKAIIFAALLIFFNIVAGILWISGFPASDRLDDDDTGTTNFRPSDPIRYYFATGLLTVLLTLVGLVVSLVPLDIVKNIGLGIVLWCSAVLLFIIAQVQGIVVGKLVYPDCEEAADDDPTLDEDECNGDKVIFVATLAFAFVIGLQFAYGAIFSGPSKKDD